jgi:hypothetical protein
MKKTALLFICFIATTNLYAQKVFEGHINYSFKIMGEGMDSYAAMMPTSMDLFSSKKAMMVKINGGMMENTMGETVSTPKGSYMIKHSEKTTYAFNSNAETSEETPTVVKEDEVLTISGFSCQKYKVTRSTPMGEQTSYAWINSDYKLPLMGAKGAESMAVPGVPGIVLKTMVSQGPMTVVLTASEFITGKQDKKYFTVPKGYAKKDYVQGAMGF